MCFKKVSKDSKMAEYIMMNSYVPIDRVIGVHVRDELNARDLRLEVGQSGVGPNGEDTRANRQYLDSHVHDLS